MHRLEGVQLDLHFAYSKSKELNCVNTNSKALKHVINENIKNLDCLLIKSSC